MEKNHIQYKYKSHLPDESKIFQISDNIEKMHNGNQLKQKKGSFLLNF